ncbi:DUF4935 domain-containing protein [Pseudomonas sp. YeP6b]|uniref:PIN domain-containing protein n=1 Tax=Pseudomonas sp. YeP6b TaxID=2861775 RepID=UPI0021DB7BAF|nr:PIN domain-containing protein [Pseudomonas sp. YeP6b]UXZ23902.1 DUF4935 domain-containing protein [Pseudomonas sp. YeP6b]
MALLTKNVFIDTQVFCNLALDFSAKNIISFEELCQKGELSHVTNTVVVQEVRKKILEFIIDGLKGIESFQRRCGFLKNDKGIADKLFPEISEYELKEKGYSDFQDFLEASNAKIIDMKKVEGNEILEIFFKQARPFGLGKKTEFRDAFSLLSLRSHLKRGEKMYVVSLDGDHKAFCSAHEQFIHVESLNSLLDICYKHIDERSKFVEKFLIEKKEDIIIALKNQIENAEGYNASTWEDAEVDEFRVTEIGEFEPDITHLDNDGCRINFNVTVKIEVDVIGPDTASGRYDREDDILYTFEDTQRKEEEEHDFSVEIDLTFEADEGGFINEDFELAVEGLTKGIEFGVEEYPWEDPRM